MPDERKIQKKFDELYKESEDANEDFKEVMFTGQSELQDMSPEEIAEVRSYLGNKFEKEEAEDAKKPKPRWTWDFYGFYIFKILMFMVEFCVICVALYFLLPLSINISITIIQTISIVTLMALVKQWMK